MNLQDERISLGRHVDFGSVLASREEEKVMRSGRGPKGGSALFVIFY